MTTTDVDAATALEADALRYPDERGAILLEAAALWLRAGEVERGVAVYLDVADAGGEDGCYARAELADHLISAGRVADGYAQLAALAEETALPDGPCVLAAELLAERDDLEGALKWYDLMVARLDPAQLDALRGSDGWLQMAAMPLRGRRHVREQLGLAPDATDELVPPDGAGAMDRVRELLRVGGPKPQRVRFRVLTFQRDERAEVRRRWPDVYVDSDEDYYPAAELNWRQRGEETGCPIQVVPGVAADLAAFAASVGGSPTDPAIKTRYIDSVPADRMLTWPPGRNAPCWCGSGRKYKKCCGGVR